MIASLALILTPGPDMIYVITRGIAQGSRAGMISAWGVCSGLIFHTALAVLGLSALLASSPIVFTLVMDGGGLYLIYMGINMVRRREALQQPGAHHTASLVTIFRQGVASNVFNPKIALFFLAFLPQFTSPSAGRLGLQMLFLGTTFTVVGLMFLSVVGYC